MIPKINDLIQAMGGHTTSKYREYEHLDVEKA